MTERIFCGFSRVFLWESKSIANKNIKQEPNESPSTFNKRVLDERFRLYSVQFSEYKKLSLDKGIVQQKDGIN